MPTRKEVLSKLPPFKGERILVTSLQSTKDIEREISAAHHKYTEEYDEIYPLFDTGDIYSTCRGLWEFCKYNLRYKAESGSSQTVRSPTAIVNGVNDVDCKHYSLFIGGVLDAIKENEGDAWSWCYRFASYNSDKGIEHVFIVVTDGNNEIWIDPVLSSFDERKKPTYFKDKQMSIYSIAGVNSLTDKTIEVGTEKAQSEFLIAVNLNLFSLRDLLLANPAVTNGPVRAWFSNNGFDFSQLERVLKSNHNG